MARLLAITLLFTAAGAIFSLWLNARRQNIARRRLERRFVAEDEADFSLSVPAADPPFWSRYWAIPWSVGAIASAALWLVAGLRPIYSVTGGLVISLLGWQLESMLAERRVQRIEAQLADAIDLMVAALRAGAGATKALENAVRESPQPLNGQLDQVASRIQFGDDPQMAFRGLTDRVPLETFLLFSSALSVHWEVGGSLAPTLATVGRTVRDRIELSRRMRAMTTQARVSIIAILGVTYFIALIMWSNDPPRMRAFLATQIGSFLVAGAILLQAVGIVWAATLSRAKV